MLAVEFFITCSIAGTTPTEQITDERADAHTDDDGLIGIFTHGFIGDLRPGDGLVADAARDLPGIVERGGKALAGIADFFTGHIQAMQTALGQWLQDTFLATLPQAPTTEVTP